MARPRRYPELVRQRLACVAAARSTLPTDKDLAKQLGSTPSGISGIIERLDLGTEAAAYELGRCAQREGKTFVHNPYLGVRGREIELRFWVDGMVDSLVESRAVMTIG